VKPGAVDAPTGVDEPPSGRTPSEPPSAQTAPWTLRGFGRSHPWWTVGVAISVVSVVLVVWARTRPGFDPYGWLVWGHQTLHLALDTNAAPSWKPLPYLFTLPYAVVGHYAVYLWLMTAVAVSLSGSVFGGRIAYRLVTGATGGPDATDAAGGSAGAGLAVAGLDRRGRIAAWVAAVVAGVGVMLIANYSHVILSAQSDPMIVALCLGAIDMQLSRRYRWAFAFWWLASLGRPEAWPFLGLYAIWAWRTLPSMRRFLVGGIVLLLVLWFGIPGITSRSPFVAGTNAIGSGRAPHGNKVTETISRFAHLEPATLSVLALLAVAWAAWRRERAVLLMAAGIVLWVVVEIAFALHGWPALPRYMFEAGGVLAVLAAVGVGWLIREPLRWSAAAGWAGVALAVVACVVLVPTAVSRARAEHKDLKEQRARTFQINALRPALSAAGGAALVRACGEPLTRLEYQSIVAFTLGVNVGHVGFKYGPAVHSSRPIVLITPGHGRWKIQALHQPHGTCRRLPT
jgi:hypothetical protein